MPSRTSRIIAPEHVEGPFSSLTSPFRNKSVIALRHLQKGSLLICFAQLLEELFLNILLFIPYLGNAVKYIIILNVEP